MVSTTAIAGVLTVLIAAAAAYFFLKAKQAKKAKDIDDGDSVSPPVEGQNVTLTDVAYLMNKLSPDSSHMDVLWAIVSSPESIKYGLMAHKMVEKRREDRAKQDAEVKEAAKKKTDAVSFDLDDGGWDDDNDAEEEDEEAKRKAKLAAAADEQKKKDMEQLNKASGKFQLKLEGFDEGVIGQKWVEKILSEKGCWPPKDLGLLNNEEYTYGGKLVGALDHPGLRRNICMLMGRLNSAMLNSHPDLLEAGAKQLVDQTYFRRSLEFRSRVSTLLEAVLRSAVASRSHALAKTVVETVSMFKVGCGLDKTEWFEGIMQKQYQCLPRLQIKNTEVANADGEKEIIPGDLISISLDLTRLHAESFTRQKIAMYQKQGIPPQIALQSYRESWWFLVRAERLDGPAPKTEMKINTNGILQAVKEEDLAKFKSATFEDQLITAWPMVVQNVAQKSGRVGINFLSPTDPGKYKFTVIVKSQDFLGADQEFDVTGTVIDGTGITRKPKEKKEAGDKKNKEEEKEEKDGKKEEPAAKKE